MMTNEQLNDICNIELQDIDTKDYPDFCDAFIANATWSNGVELTEAELDDINDNHSDFVYEAVLDSLY